MGRVPLAKLVECLFQILKILTESERLESVLPELIKVIGLICDNYFFMKIRAITRVQLLFIFNLIKLNAKNIESILNHNTDFDKLVTLVNITWFTRAISQLNRVFYLFQKFSGGQILDILLTVVSDRNLTENNVMATCCFKEAQGCMRVFMIKPM